MANKQRGEVDFKIGGKTYKAVLTLGALAHLEDVFGIEKPGELDRIISFPTYNQLATLSHALINYKSDEELITREAILDADVRWQEVYEAIIAAVGAANPAGKDGKKGNEESGETAT